MPIEGTGFELHIVRRQVQSRGMGAVTRQRTISTYQVFVEGVAQPGLAGFMAEQKGPSDSTLAGNQHDRRIAPGRFTLWTQLGSKYRTNGYTKTNTAANNFAIKPRPGIELKGTGDRLEILIHPAVGFLSSEGCIHPTGALANGNADIAHTESRARVIALIEAMKAFAGDSWPNTDGHRIPGCFCVVEDNL